MKKAIPVILLLSTVSVYGHSNSILYAGVASGILGAVVAIISAVFFIKTQKGVIQKYVMVPFVALAVFAVSFLGFFYTIGVAIVLVLDW